MTSTMRPGTAVIITGMHRSGTSMVARLLNLCGVHLGPYSDLIAPDEDNQAGFWENKNVASFNERLLNDAGGGWDCPPESEPSIAEYEREALEVLRAIETDGLWGFKAPRASLLLPFWFEVLPDAKVVVCLRDPREVAQSLQKRNGSSIASGLWLWQMYNKALRQWRDDDSLIVTHYDAYFYDAHAELRRVLDFLGIVANEEQVARACLSITTRLRHNRATIDGMDGTPPGLIELYRDLCEKARYDPKTPRLPFTSLVVLTYNGLEHTRNCLASIVAHTPENHELIIVDNGSTDGTVDFLREFVESARGVKVIANSQNRGFASGMNQGISLARGEIIMLMNNDLVVTPGWLSRLLAPFKTMNVGLVGPMSNFVSGAQLVPEVPYRDVDSLLEFADKWTRAHVEQSIPTQRLVAFCLAIHRDVIERIGGLDERFFPGNYEDDDYAIRAAMVGYEARIARDVFIHHVGHVGFSTDGQNLEAALQENWVRFKEKWGLPADLERECGFQLQTPPFDPTEHYQPLPIIAQQPTRMELIFEPDEPVAEWPRITLAMIVRDEETNLADAVESAGDLCREIIIVDTGSTDKTVEIAESLGAEVRHFEWCSDFAAARNASIDGAQGEWIFWMDADDRLTLDVVEQLKLAASSDLAAAYICNVFSRVRGLGESIIISQHTRLFRNHLDLKFAGRCHEDVTPQVLKAGLQVAYTNIEIEHVGYDCGPEVLRQKAIRNRDIVLEELAAQPDDLKWRYHLGVCEFIAGDLPGAIENLKAVIANPPPTISRDSELYQAHTLLITGSVNLGRMADAERYINEAMRIYPYSRHLWITAGMVYMNAGQWSRAVETLEKAATLPESMTRWPPGVLEEHLEMARENSRNACIEDGRSAPCSDGILEADESPIPTRIPV